MTACKLRTIWPLCLPAAVFLLFVFFCRVKPWAASGRLTDKRPCRTDCVTVLEWAWVRGRGCTLGLSDGCAPIHHSGPRWWAKEPTCGGEGEVVSEESALFDYSRSIIRARTAQRLSARWQSAEWLLPLWAKEQCADQEKKEVAKGPLRMIAFGGFRGINNNHERVLERDLVLSDSRSKPA